MSRGVALLRMEGSCWRQFPPYPSGGSQPPRFRGRDSGHPAARFVPQLCVTASGAVRQSLEPVPAGARPLRGITAATLPHAERLSAVLRLKLRDLSSLRQVGDRVWEDARSGRETEPDRRCARRARSGSDPCPTGSERRMAGPFPPSPSEPSAPPSRSLRPRHWNTPARRTRSSNAAPPCAGRRPAPLTPVGGARRDPDDPTKPACSPSPPPHPEWRPHLCGSAGGANLRSGAPHAVP